MWDEQLTIPVHMPDFCMLDLVVRDHSTTGSNYILGHYCIHFDDLMPGESTGPVLKPVLQGWIAVTATMK